MRFLLKLTLISLVLVSTFGNANTQNLERVGVLVRIVDNTNADLDEFSTTIDNIVSPEWRVSSASNARYEVKLTATATSVGNCAYQGGHTLFFKRIDVTVIVTDLESNEEINSRLFRGATFNSNDCPITFSFSSSTDTVITGINSIGFEAWLEGIFENLSDLIPSNIVVTLVSGETEVLGASYSPTGDKIVTASSDNIARVWDASSGEELLQLIGHSDRVNSVAYSPSGAFIVTASRDKTVRVWDIQSGNEVLQISGHTGIVNSAQYSPDEKYIITASTADHTVRIWDATTGIELQQLAKYSGAVNAATYSSDGRFVLVATSEIAHLLDAVTGNELRLLQYHKTKINSVNFSPDQTFIVTASNDGTAIVWNISELVGAS